MPEDKWNNSVAGVFRDALSGGKYFLLLTAIVSFLASLTVFFISEKRYSSTASILPSSSEIADGGITEESFADLGALIGIKQSGTEMILYPDILRSRTISLDILKESYTFSEDGREVTRSLQEHLGIESDEAAQIILNSRVSSFWIDKSAMALVIRVTTDNPVLSAAVVNAYIDRLERYNREQRRSLSREVHAFVGKKLESSRDELLRADEVLRDFREINRDYAISTEPGLLMQMRRLERRVRIGQALYFELSRQYEKAAFEMNRDTPTLNILDRGTVPAAPSWPDPFQIILSITLAGIFAGIFFLAAREGLRRWVSGRDRDEVRALLAQISADIGRMPFIHAGNNRNG
ncbi:MAG: hypothetical protein JW814_01015 [Candidatus Krumholzibacteriota bacterium]|nr:hypothetical protein [Candidatus Krumholzibacteriota bacterium]